MKNILFTIILPLLLTAGLAPRAEASRCYGGTSTYVSGRTHCGCPIYTQRYVAYYNHCGQPVFRYRTLPVRHSCHRRSYHYRHGCKQVVVPSTGCGTSYRSHGSHSGHRGVIPKPALPHISFSPGGGVHLGIGCR
jgi:hypothetical protein